MANAAAGFAPYRRWLLGGLTAAALGLSLCALPGARLPRLLGLVIPGRGGMLQGLKLLYLPYFLGMLIPAQTAPSGQGFWGAACLGALAMPPVLLFCGALVGQAAFPAAYCAALALGTGAAAGAEGRVYRTSGIWVSLACLYGSALMILILTA